MPEMILRCPDFRLPERQYIARTILTDFLGLACRVEAYGGDVWRLSDTQGTRALLISDSFFSGAHEKWLEKSTLPGHPLSLWNVEADLPGAVLSSPDVPVIAGEPGMDGTWFSNNDAHDAYLGLDVLGSAFFMLTRYEELVTRERDPHKRFPCAASLAGSEGFVDRPIVNEYTEILWTAMKRLWPGLEREDRVFRVFLTHDVDVPYEYALRSSLKAIKKACGDILKRRSISLTVRNLRASCRVKGGEDKDHYDTFDWIMDQSERFGFRSTFNFMAADKSKYNNGYAITNERIQSLLHRILDRDHEIGFHPGYETVDEQEVWSRQLHALRNAIPANAVLKGGRQHYLRFQTPLTWRFWSESDLEYDTTVGFADSAGFRCGTCYPFTAFDVAKGERLSLVERPLIAMEGTVIKKQYMGLGLTDDALKIFVELSRRCKMFGGEFVLLWHNSFLEVDAQKELYSRVLSHL